MTAGTIAERICALLSALDKPLTLPEIAALLDLDSSRVSSALSKMTERGQLGRAGDRPKRYQLASRMPARPPVTTVQSAIERTKSSVFGCWMSV